MVFRVTKEKKGESKVGPFNGEETEAKRRNERKLVSVFLVEKRKRVAERAKGKEKRKRIAICKKKGQERVDRECEGRGEMILFWVCVFIFFFVFSHFNFDKRDKMCS